MRKFMCIFYRNILRQKYLTTETSSFFFETHLLNVLEQQYVLEVLLSRKKYAMNFRERWIMQYLLQHTFHCRLLLSSSAPIRNSYKPSREIWVRLTIALQEQITSKCMGCLYSDSDCISSGPCLVASCGVSSSKPLDSTTTLMELVDLRDFLSTTELCVWHWV